MSRSSYERWFVLSCTRTVEMRYTLAGRLVGLGIVDVGQLDASSVYFFFDPDESRRSLGVMSVMAEIAWLKAQGGRFHYLGLYVEDCRHLVYKATYLPHERRIGGAWQRALSVPAEETAP
jgi:arginine-tRNA-protein transferase